jgi:hypothetical protein
MRKLLPLAFLAALGGCVSDQIATLPAGTRSEEIARQFGAPTLVRREGEGQTWEFAQGPRGVKTFLVHLDAAGQLRSVEQVLDETHFAQVRAGASPEEILKLLGRPGGEWSYPVVGEKIWSYRYLDTPVRPMFFNVHFDLGNGLVKTTSRSLDPSEEPAPIRMR